jgi:hypothetical protein
MGRSGDGFDLAVARFFLGFLIVLRRWFGFYGFFAGIRGLLSVC